MVQYWWSIDLIMGIHYTQNMYIFSQFFHPTSINFLRKVHFQMPIERLSWCVPSISVLPSWLLLSPFISCNSCTFWSNRKFLTVLKLLRTVTSPPVFIQIIYSVFLLLVLFFKLLSQHSLEFRNQFSTVSPLMFNGTRAQHPVICMSTPARISDITTPTIPISKRIKHPEMTMHLSIPTLLY